MAAAETDTTTLIDAQAEIQGKLIGRDARVLGRFRGEIELQGRFSSGESSRVEARLKADSAEIAGEFVGEISVRSLTLTERARVEGTIQTDLLIVREGAWLQASVTSTGALSRPVEVRPALSAGQRVQLPPLKGAAAS
jgi:cytoskeletal protein CcmA (bactofilin family)